MNEETLSQNSNPYFDEEAGYLFADLSEKQRSELLLADDESRDENNHLSYEEVRIKHREWLKS